jgi:DNA-binding MarR family transcriptional regulator
MCPSLGPELQDVDDLTIRTFQAMARVGHLNRLAVQKSIAQRGVQPPEAFALAFLSDHDGATQSELAKLLHLSPPRVSTILSRLEESGAVLRRADEADRRLTRVFITPEGRRREEEHRTILGEYVNRTIGALPKADRLELACLLEKLADRTNEVLSEGWQGGGGGAQR